MESRGKTQHLPNWDEVHGKLDQRDKPRPTGCSKTGQESVPCPCWENALGVGGRGPRGGRAGARVHSPPQALSSLPSEQSRKPSQRSESKTQASLSSHLNSRLVQVSVLCVAATQGRGRAVRKAQPAGRGVCAFRASQLPLPNTPLERGRGAPCWHRCPLVGH